MDIVIASGNAGKLKEFASLLEGADIRVLSQADLGIEGAEETGLTFIENAILKARHAAAESGNAALADDSGLAVDALQGAPGIYSARYSGPEATDQSNIVALLDALKDVPTEQRQAQFHCVLVFVRHALDPTPLVCHGVWEGLIAQQPSGNGGFGYDPVFWIPDLNCTAADLTREQKSEISHRGKALRQLRELLPALQKKH
jgi:XTP/dITP diphosphohydrolase